MIYLAASPEAFPLPDDEQLATAANVVLAGVNAPGLSTPGPDGHFPGLLPFESQLDFFLFRQFKSTLITN